MLRFILPEVDGWPVQPEVGAGCEEEGAGTGDGAGGDEGAAGGSGSPGGGVAFGARRACADGGPRRAFMLLGFLCPSLFFTPVGGVGFLNSGKFAYGSGAKSGVGRGRCEIRLGFRAVDFVELTRLDDEEDEGAGEVKVTFLAFGGSI